MGQFGLPFIPENENARSETPARAVRSIKAVDLKHQMHQKAPIGTKTGITTLGNLL